MGGLGGGVGRLGVVGAGPCTCTHPLPYSGPAAGQCDIQMMAGGYINCWTQ